MSTHRFQAFAFAENFALRSLAEHFPGAEASTHDLRIRRALGEMWLFPFGVVVFRDVDEPALAAALGEVRGAMPALSAEAVRESFDVREDPARDIRLEAGVLAVDRLTPERAGVVARTIAQSASMEYYERIVEHQLERLARWVDRLRRRGTLPTRTRELHRSMAEAIANRREVLSVLHLLDKPEATWDDPAMDRIYDDLRSEFDLTDRYRAMESKLSAIQDALGVLVEVARDRRLLLLEVAVVLLIALEILLGLSRLS